MYTSFMVSYDVNSTFICLCVSRLEDVGLEKFSVPVLFARIFIPAAFLLVLTFACYLSTDTVTGLGRGISSQN